MFDKGYNDGVAAYNSDVSRGRVAQGNSEISTRARDSLNNLPNARTLSQQDASAYFMGFITGYTAQDS
jgi:hypothetical protein